MNLIKKIWVVVKFIFSYLAGLVKANMLIAADLLTPGLKARPGFVSIPLDARTDHEILTLVNLISMTPGTLSVDVTADKKQIFVHAMYLDDAEAFKKEIKENLEKKVLEVYR